MRQRSSRFTREEGPRAIARTAEEEPGPRPLGAAWKAQLVLQLWAIAFLLTLIVKAALR